jgi:hypothetical protein
MLGLRGPIGERSNRCGKGGGRRPVYSGEGLRGWAGRRCCVERGEGHVAAGYRRGDEVGGWIVALRRKAARKRGPLWGEC